MIHLARRVKSNLRVAIRSTRLAVSSLSAGEYRRFDCPVCRYGGLFRRERQPYGNRKHAVCPSCDAAERHRLQWLVFRDLAAKHDLSRLRLLHCAPEAFFRKRLKRLFGRYETADLYMQNVDHTVDLCALPFESASYDCVCASHVLEHIEDDRAAIGEIRRILRPGGFAVLPVPIVADATIEYPEANPFEVGHWRAPGPDYFDKYRERFREVVEYSSADFPEKHQVYIYERRDHWPTAEMPHKRPMHGERHADRVPVCYV